MNSMDKGNTIMNTHKISISLPNQLFEFIEEYQENHHYKTRSEVINQALYLLQQAHLEACYREASQEVNEDFEATTQDGLEDETW